MKYISFAIPCYNSQDYMERAIESILPGGDEVEILIVNDGSSDRTSEIAHEYMEKYPGVVRVIDKENGSTAAMEMRSTRGLALPGGNILKWWTATTG